MSKEDEKWTVDLFSKVFGNKSFGQLTTEDFIGAFKDLVHGLEPDPSKRTFGEYAYSFAVACPILIVMQVEAW